MMRYVFFSVLIILAACQTTPPPVVVQVDESVGAEDYRQLDEIELLLLDYRAGGEIEALLQAEYAIGSFLRQPTLNKEFEARVHGLQGEILFFRGNLKAAKDALRAGETGSTAEPQLFLLKALLEPEPSLKLPLLEAGLQAAPGAGRLLLEMAEVCFSLDEYGKATGYYDEAFRSLPEAYRTYYLKNRNLAFQLIGNPPDAPGIRDYIRIDKLLVSDLLQMLLQTPYLDTITPQVKPALPVLLAELKLRKYLVPEYIALDDPLVRKDLAVLLLQLISNLENNQQILHTYSDQFILGELDSPVPDVKVTDYFFDAVLNLVERELMELPDGINFFPNHTVSGLELNEILKNLKLHYGY